MTATSPPGTDAIGRALTQAVHSSDTDYLRAESALRAGGSPTAARLRAIAAGAQDSLVRFVAATIADWIDEPVDELTLALQWIDAQERARRRTPSPGPRPDVIELGLREAYNARIAPYLALRVLKESWPGWKVAGCLLYLRYQRVPATAPALALLALTAADPQLRDLARSALVATVGEPAVDARLAEAQDSLDRLRGAAQSSPGP